MFHTSHLHTSKIISPNKGSNAPFFQPKLTINQPNDVYEREADIVADKLMGMRNTDAAHQPFFKPAPAVIQRKCAHCEQEEKQHLQRKETNDTEASASNELNNYIENLPGGGQALSDEAKNFFEPRMGYDFSNVKVHTDNHAARSAQSINALAYTSGNNIVFNSGQYNPDTDKGKRLLGHELTHIVQQQQNPQAKKIQRITDTEVESSTGVDAGISNGTMTADAIMGQVYTASCSMGSYNVSFKFTKAYRGTYPYRAAARDVKGIYVKIEMSIIDNRYCGRCTPMRGLQVLRNTTRGSSGNLETADPVDPTRRTRSGWDTASAPSRGWRVDTLTSSTNPYYTSTWVGQEGSETTPAIIWDTPGDWSTDTNMGKDFYTCIVCQNAAGRRWIAGCVNWGYFIDSSGGIAFLPAVPVATCGPMQQVSDATQRWDAIAGNTPTGIT